MLSKRHIYLCLSLDVEEEGLFRGTYAIASTPVANLHCLHRLRPLCEMGARPTLFCAYPVLTDDAAFGCVEKLGSDFPIEVGAHLHHWNTPPLADPALKAVQSVPSIDLDDATFQAKLESVLSAGEQRTGSRPTSFRMGRWDLHARHWPLLARAGVLTDASVRPLHMGSRENQAPNHFLAPQTTPYLVATSAGTVFEVPLTVTSLSPLLTRLLLLSKNQKLLSSLQHWGVLALLPVYHPLWAMQAITSLVVARGSDVISLTWHSSEMMPGGNPHMPDERSIDAFLRKCGAYLAWLKKNFEVTFVTMDELRRERAAHCQAMIAGDGDWTCGNAPHSV